MWYRITVKQPKHDRQVLVWTGHHMFVARAVVYDTNKKAWYDDPEITITPEEKAKYRKIDKELTGSFNDMGEHFYFNNPKIFWMELPKPPL